MPSKRNKRVRKQDRPFEWMLASNKRSYSRVAVVGERIILSSLRHPSLNIIFTINHWAHFVAMLQDVNETAYLRTSDHLNVKQLDVDVFHSANTWMTAFTSLRFIVNILLTFANTLRSMVSQIIQYSPLGMVLAFVWKMNGSICSKMSFLHIHRHYPVFANTQPQCGCLLYGNDNDMNNHLGWKVCTVCYPFGR